MRDWMWSGSRVVLALAVGAVLSDAANATTLTWSVPLISEDQVKNSPADPPGDGSTDSAATGWATITIRDNPARLEGIPDTFYLISYILSWEALEGDLTKIHFHGGEGIGPETSTPTHLHEPPDLRDEQAVIDWAATLPPGARRTGSYSVLDLPLTHAHPFDDPIARIETPEIVDHFVAGRAYINVHTNAHPVGEIRGNLSAIPEPGTLWLCAVGAFAWIGARRLRA